jgi:alpha,alpha-trehalase
MPIETRPNTIAADLDLSLIRQIETFISSRWEQTVRFAPNDCGTLIGLPFPYTVPCARDSFQELYYWDTYFTCVGLLRSERADLAVANARNFFSLIDRYGFVPNGNRTLYLYRSQPPYLAPLVALISEAGHPECLTEALPFLRKEYQFWDQTRRAPIGLSHYGHHGPPEESLRIYNAVKVRASLPEGTEEENLICGTHTLAECESGWDFTPRFQHRCADFCPVDLNANLFLMETLLSTCTPPDEQQHWRTKAADRQQRVNDHCWDEAQGAFFYFDFRNGERGRILSAATFHPLWSGMASIKQAGRIVQDILPRLEYSFGITACEPGGSTRMCQWDHPHGWACLQYIAYRGLERYGYATEAARLAAKYLSVVSRTFAETGDLWEKYSVTEGSVAQKEEAGWTSPAMMGWTAGVFLDAVALLFGPPGA